MLIDSLRKKENFNTCELGTWWLGRLMTWIPALSSSCVLSATLWDPYLTKPLQRLRSFFHWTLMDVYHSKNYVCDVYVEFVDVLSFCCDKCNSDNYPKWPQIVLPHVPKPTQSLYPWLNQLCIVKGVFCALNAQGILACLGVFIKKLGYHFVSLFSVVQVRELHLAICKSPKMRQSL